MALNHAGTRAAVKKHIVDNALWDDGHIRCLITTVAFGMGVNCKRVRKNLPYGTSQKPGMLCTRKWKRRKRLLASCLYSALQWYSVKPL